MLALILAFLLAVPAAAQAPPRAILAIGAHAGDMEVTSAAVLARQKERGDRIVLLHLTLGEAGNPKLPPRAYGEQKRREALEAANVLGAEVIFGPYRDGEIPNDDGARKYVAGVIRRVKPACILTHWRRSLHRDHSVTHDIVTDAVLLASLESVVTDQPRYRGVRGIFYTENWEDADEFKPYLYVDVTAELARWKECVTRYEFIRGGISSFPYLDYYEALARVRGAESGRRYAVSFDVDPTARKRVLDALP